jgi:AraC-like DNA-binding protein
LEDGEIAGVLFDFLRSDPSFQIVSETESGGFDNACDVWKSLGVLVRFVCDRGQVSVEISSVLTEKWHDLGLVRIMVEGGDAMERPTLDELAVFFRANQAQLARLFSRDEIITTGESLAELRRQRARRMFPKMNPRANP